MREDWFLDTERCHVRCLELSDLDALYELYGGEGICDFITPLYDREKEAEYQRQYRKQVYETSDLGMWVVLDKWSKVLIGRCGFAYRPDEDSGIELGYIIRKDRQNQGLAKEVCGALLEYACSLGYRDFYCRINPQNKPSRRVAEALGFENTGEVREDSILPEEVWRLLV